MTHSVRSASLNTTIPKTQFFSVMFPWLLQTALSLSRSVRKKYILPNQIRATEGISCCNIICIKAADGSTVDVTSLAIKFHWLRASKRQCKHFTKCRSANKKRMCQNNFRNKNKDSDSHLRKRSHGDSIFPLLAVSH